MAESFDAVVIGGGPAGSIAAISLAQLGWRTALIERRASGTGKSCGHCLSLRAMSMLEAAGAQSLDSGRVIARVIRSAAVGETRTMTAYTARSSAGISAATFSAPALLTPRDSLDHRLIREAQLRGVTVFQPTTARIAQIDDHYQTEIIVRRADADATMETDARRLRTGLLIGADGLRSRVAAAFNLQGPRRPGRKFGFSMRLRSEMLNNSTVSAPGRSVGIDMFISPHGYLGVVRESDNLLHCAALVQPATGHLSRNPHAFCAAMSESFPQLRGLVAAVRHAGAADPRASDDTARDPLFAAGPMPCRPVRVACRGAALIGDAAGYVEPFTGEGMTWAIESALVLADICQPLTPGRWTACDAARYEARYRERIARRQRLCRLISFGLARPWLWRAVLRRGAISTFLGQHIAERLRAA